jgi:dTDP-4-amino-4,6-dideoxygalactose transaminase
MTLVNLVKKPASVGSNATITGRSRSIRVSLSARLQRRRNPYAEQAAAEELSLPTYPELTADMHAEVAAAVIELWKAEQRG